MPDAAPPSDVPTAPPPWTLTAESWLFPFWTSSSTKRQHQAAKRQTAQESDGAEVARQLGLPPGSFHPLEALASAHVAKDHGEFKGGLGAWILYRYTDSPAGPYDELIYVAGFFKSPDGKKSTPRITNIYVSTRASVWNGRRNWNIPKHVAEFSWSHPVHSDEAGVQTVSVRHPAGSPLRKAGGSGSGDDDDDAPFFSASLQPSRLPSVPVNTNLAIFPALPLLQPPLSDCSGPYGGDGDDADRRKLVEAAVASPSEGVWRSTAPTFRGGASMAYAKPLLSGGRYGDERGFPAATRTWSTGIRFRKVIVSFPEPVEARF
ncbi:uncharacterized protein PFL1_01845 [Pseudozyma flocculosa PF-1]|uniref:Uncharacterized protein n=1 Tax=Pseudozyma flocculosa TaxID=84751 RepID=A0A5C3F1N3_9BASI|nr:uncharacterized protein PFL1_01845 [Pseudozyma flocculosa PF-1]EPQ30319.1 hypothetical protein PFL1_01845 [Pseudozyma flocculosa PF-1]SPO37389.1 uncharacterized protein PSFLO_02862 [Pseudozyma flocculosa]